MASEKMTMLAKKAVASLGIACSKSKKLIVGTMNSISAARSRPETVVNAVLISEVGPRDGLQSVKATMPTADKLRWITALHASGLREIEGASFVPARVLPQMADAADVVMHALTLSGLRVMALVPNVRGALSALQAGVHKLTIPVSASAAHSLANISKTREEMLEEVRRIVALRDQVLPGALVEVGISTAFGCTLQGLVAEDDVIWVAMQCAAAGVDEVGLSDTTGYANPAQRTCTTRAAWDWPIALPPTTRAYAPLMPRWAGWEVVRMRRARQAMW